MNKEIKNLLFDLGGVIMNLKRANCVRAFEALGMVDAVGQFGEYSQKGAFLNLEEGLIDVDTFHAEVRKMIPNDVTDEMIDNAFCQFLDGIPVHRMRALEEYRKTYKVFLLSNTNSIHINGRIKPYFCADGKDLNHYFDGLVLSYEAKAAKPDPKIFEYAIKTLGIKPEETLFLDDSQKNLDAAAQLGFHTGLVAPGMEFVDVIADKLSRKD